MAEGGTRWKDSLDTLFATRLLKGMIAGLVLRLMILHKESLFQAAERYMLLIEHSEANEDRNILKNYKPKVSESDINWGSLDLI